MTVTFRIKQHWPGFVNAYMIIDGEHRMVSFHDSVDAAQTWVSDFTDAIASGPVVEIEEGKK